MLFFRASIRLTTLSARGQGFGPGFSLYPDKHYRAHRNPIVKIDNVVVGHAETARRNRLPDGFWLIRAVNAIKCRSKIQRSRAQGIFEAAWHETRQVRAPGEHFGWRKPVGPFPFRADAESACPTVPIATHPDSVTNSLASASHEVEPPFCGVDVDGSWRVAALKINNGARNRPRAAAAVIKEGSERTDHVSWLGLLGKGKADL